jgi:hypothetical protein
MPEFLGRMQDAFSVFSLSLVPVLLGRAFELQAARGVTFTEDAVEYVAGLAQRCAWTDPDNGIDLLNLIADELGAPAKPAAGGKGDGKAEAKAGGAGAAGAPKKITVGVTTDVKDATGVAQLVGKVCSNLFDPAWDAADAIVIFSNGIADVKEEKKRALAPEWRSKAAAVAGLARTLQRCLAWQDVCALLAQFALSALNRVCLDDVRSGCAGSLRVEGCRVACRP